MSLNPMTLFACHIDLFERDLGDGSMFWQAEYAIGLVRFLFRSKTVKNSSKLKT